MTRERTASQLMTALYRSGRQSDALEAYQRTRARLAADLGLEPGPALKVLQRQILEQAPALQAGSEGRVPGTSGKRDGRAGRRFHRWPRRRSVVIGSCEI